MFMSCLGYATSVKVAGYNMSVVTVLIEHFSFLILYLIFIDIFNLFDGYEVNWILIKLYACYKLQK